MDEPYPSRRSLRGDTSQTLLTPITGMPAVPVAANPEFATSTAPITPPSAPTATTTNPALPAVHYAPYSPAEPVSGGPARPLTAPTTGTVPAAGNANPNLLAPASRVSTPVPASQHSSQAPSSGLVLRVDWPLCKGHLLCHEMIPELIDRDEWGYPIIKGEIPEDYVYDAKNVVKVCPALALRLVPARR